MASASREVERLRRDSTLIGASLLPDSEWPPRAADYGFAGLVEHPRLDLISYPYEWPFEALRAAAIAHLDIHQALLTDDLTLVDATAFNMQFIGAKPIFIDTASIRPYREGEYWLGHDQFLRQFLNPLLLESICGVAFADLYRGGIEGITSQVLNRLVPYSAKWRPSVFANVVLPARLSRSQPPVSPTPTKRPGLPKASLKGLLLHLRAVIAGLKVRRDSSAWSGYSAQNSYAQEARLGKLDAVREFCSRRRPSRLVDIGGNDGEYSFLAIEAGAQSAIVLDTDRASLDRGYLRALTSAVPITLLHADAANLSPSQGWRGRERSDLRSRLACDALLALAIVHHLAIARNIPLDDVVDYLVSWAPAGMVEFVPKSDPMVALMLAQREDVFPDYGYPAFRSSLQRRARIVKETELAGSSRILFEYERHS